MWDYFKNNSSICSFSGSDSWVILSDIEQSIKRKIEAVGTPLRDWNINIYRGILTGCNEAFIISGAKRDEILKNCLTEEERTKTAELIRPILRGRDIKRYGYNFADLWLIATFPSKHYNIDDFPAVKKYLLSFGIEKLEQTGATHYINGKEIKARKKTNNKWFETQDSISYWDLFFQHKICWKAVGRNLAFSIVPPGVFLTAPASFISASDDNEYILAFLCSKTGRYYIYKNSDTTGAGDIMLNIQSLIRFPIPIYRNSQIINLIHHIIDNCKEGLSISNAQALIDKEIYSTYKFSEQEIHHIENVS